MIFVILCSSSQQIVIMQEQSITIRRYPAELSLSSLICLVGAMESAVVALVAEHRSQAWTIGFDYRLYGPLYTVSTTITCFQLQSLSNLYINMRI